MICVLKHFHIAAFQCNFSDPIRVAFGIHVFEKVVLVMFKIKSYHYLLFVINATPPHPHVTERKFTKRWEVFLLHIPWEMLVNNCMYFICRAKSCLMFLMRPSSQRTLILTVVEVWGRLFSIRKGNHLGEVSLMFWFTNFVKKKDRHIITSLEIGLLHILFTFIRNL